VLDHVVDQRSGVAVDQIRIVVILLTCRSATHIAAVRVGRVSCLCVTLKFTKNIGNCALPPHRSGQDQVCSIINSEQTLSSRQAGSAGLFSVYHVDVCVVVCLLLVIRCTSYHSGLGCVSSFLFLFFSFSCSRVCVFACSLARSLSLSVVVPADTEATPL
jgi:hypothetical protein